MILCVIRNVANSLAQLTVEARFRVTYGQTHVTAEAGPLRKRSCVLGLIVLPGGLTWRGYLRV